MAPQPDDAYKSPAVTQYGDVESITNSKDKCGEGDDQFSANTPLTGSVVDTGEC